MLYSIEDKAKRQKELLSLLNKKDFSNQGQVVKAMKDAGIKITQPSISRDFRELGIVRVSGKYKALPKAKSDHMKSTASNFLTRTVSELISTIEVAGPNMVVVKSHEGAAGIIGAAIDRAGMDGVVGTVAGDDTIFIAINSKQVQNQVIVSLRRL